MSFSVSGLGFTAGVTRVRTINPDVMTKAIHSRMVTLWKECVREFVKAAALQIHVDSGMSQASLLPLANTVNLTMYITGRKSLVKHTYKGWTDIDGVYHNDRTKSVSLGSLLGRSPAYPVNLGTSARPVLSFKFEIMIYQYALHELGQGGQAAWDSLTAGSAAFHEQLDTWEERIPDIPHFTLTGEIQDAI